MSSRRGVSIADAVGSAGPSGDVICLARVLNPGAEAVREYSPGIKLGATYSPDSCVVVLNSTPVFTFLILIATLGTTATLVSRTVPAIVPRST
jgi:hypothetical protein